MSRRSAIVLCILSMLAMTFLLVRRLRVTPSPERSPERSSAIGNSSDERTAPESQELAYSHYRVSSLKGRDVSILSSALAQCPRGHRELLAMLTEEDKGKVKFALSGLASAPDLNDISALVACAERNRDDAALVFQVRLALSNVVDPDYLPFGSCDLRDWYDHYQTQLDRMTFAGMWGDRVMRLNSSIGSWRSPRVAQDALQQSLSTLLLSNDAGETAPVIVRLILEAEPKATTALNLPGLFRALQAYIGPLDVPHLNDPAGQTNAQHSLALWWNLNKDKKPVFWFLDRLAHRGRETDRPSDPRRTAAALLSALSDGSPVERYAASKVLAYALPDGDSIVLDRGALINGESRSHEQQLMDDFLLKFTLCRAYDWYFFRCEDYAWDLENGKYRRLQEKEEMKVTISRQDRKDKPWSSPTSMPLASAQPPISSTTTSTSSIRPAISSGK